MNSDKIEGSLAGLGSAYIGFGIALSDARCFALGVVVWFASYLVPHPEK